MAWYQTNIGGTLKETVLWTNPTPTAIFEKQTVTLPDNISNYSYLKIVSRLSTSNSNSGSFLIPTDEFKAEENNMSGWGSALKDTSIWYQRLFTKDGDTGVLISAGGRRGGTGSYNGYAIPISIIGLK